MLSPSLRLRAIALAVVRHLPVLVEVARTSVAATRARLAVAAAHTANFAFAEHALPTAHDRTSHVVASALVCASAAFAVVAAAHTTHIALALAAAYSVAVHRNETVVRAVP